MSYSSAFETLMSGNITGAVIEGYTVGAGLGSFFYMFIIIMLLTPVYITTESFEAVGLTMLVLAGAGLVANIGALGGDAVGNLNIVAIFGIMVAFGFTLILYGLLGRRE